LKTNFHSWALSRKTITPQTLCGSATLWGRWNYRCTGRNFSSGFRYYLSI